MTRVYLDHAATTPIATEVVARWVEVASMPLGNSTGAHRAARAARAIVEDARERVAARCGVRPAQIVFTSGGTESDHLGIEGLARRHGVAADAVACSSIEHPAVRDVVERLGGRVLPVDRRGHLDLDALDAACRTGVRLVAVMGVNNETGVVQRTDEIASVIERAGKGRVLWHCDTVQAPVWRDLRTHAAGATTRALSGHKFGGPSGVGILIVAEGMSLEPGFVGGGQERAWRSGSHAVAGIAALAVGLERIDDGRHEIVERIRTHRDTLVAQLMSQLDGVGLTAAPGELSLPDDVADGFAHLLIDGVHSEALLVLLDQADVAASAGSSCSSGATQMSPVLDAMGVDPADARGALRLSLGWTTTTAEIDRAVEVIVSSVERLRSNAQLGAAS